MKEDFKKTIISLALICVGMASVILFYYANVVAFEWVGLDAKQAEGAAFLFVFFIGALGKVGEAKG